MRLNRFAIRQWSPPVRRVFGFRFPPRPAKCLQAEHKPRVCRSFACRVPAFRLRLADRNHARSYQQCKYIIGSVLHLLEHLFPTTLSFNLPVIITKCIMCILFHHRSFYCFPVPIKACVCAQSTSARIDSTWSDQVSSRSRLISFSPRVRVSHLLFSFHSFNSQNSTILIHFHSSNDCFFVFVSCTYSHVHSRSSLMARDTWRAVWPPSLPRLCSKVMHLFCIFDSTRHCSTLPRRRYDDKKLLFTKPLWSPTWLEPAPLSDRRLNLFALEQSQLVKFLFTNLYLWFFWLVIYRWTSGRCPHRRNQHFRLILQEQV